METELTDSTEEKNESGATTAANTQGTVTFEAMNLQVGVRLQVLVVRDIKPIQYFSTLIGYVKDEYLIIKTPFDNGTPIALREGDRITMRVFSGVRVCSFDATVLREFLHPLFYLHLSFPRVIRGTSLRAAMRVKVEIPAQATKSGAGPVSVLLDNVSAAGALIESPEELGDTNSALDLSCTVVTQPAGKEMRLDTRATIRNCSKRPASEGRAEVFLYGVEFTELDPTHQIVLQNLAYEALIGDRQRLV